MIPDRNEIEERDYHIEMLKADREWEQFCKSTYLSNKEKEVLAEHERVPTFPKPKKKRVRRLTEEELMVAYSEYIDMKRFKGEDQ